MLPKHAVESQPRSEEPLDEGEPLISQNFYAYPCKQKVQLSFTSGGESIIPLFYFQMWKCDIN